MIKKLARLSLPMVMLTAFHANAEIKIAVLNFQQAIVQSQEAEAKLAEIREDLEQEQVELTALGEEIKGLNDKLIKDAEVMSDDEQRRISKSIEDKQIDYQFGLQKLQKALQDRQQDMLREMQPKLNAVLKDLIDLEGYDVVMERQAFLYVNPKHDVTRKVTELLNDKQ